MEKRDVPRVKTLADDIHKSYPEEEAVFRERLHLYPAGCHTLALGDRLVGYCIAHPWLLGAAPGLNTLLGALPLSPDALYIHDLALAVDARGKRAAQRQIAALVLLAMRDGFTCLSLTAVNYTEGFWSKNGFRLSERKNETAGLASYGTKASYMVRSLVRISTSPGADSFSGANRFSGS